MAPHVERTAHILTADRGDTVTPLTRANHKTAWDNRNRSRRARPAPSSAPALPDSCRDCGAPVPTRRHRYCESCRQSRWQTNGNRGRQNAAAVLARLRAEQRDPGHGGRAAQLRGSKNAAHQAAVAAWVGERPDPSVFSSEILPGLREMPIASIAAATGLSEHYCSLIRLGKRTPHVRHWESLRACACTGSRLASLPQRED